eukprot:4088540-Karenia_brevis.AAC.1
MARSSPSEPAWHIRQRKKRSAARDLLRAYIGTPHPHLHTSLAQAHKLLSTHHGSSLPSQLLMAWKPNNYNYNSNHNNRWRRHNNNYNNKQWAQNNPNNFHHNLLPPSHHQNNMGPQQLPTA